MNKFLKLWTLLSLLSISIFTVSCNDDDDETDEGELEQSALDGIWMIDETWIVKITAHQGVFVVLDADAQHKGLSNFLKVGDLAIQKLKKQSNNVWSGEEIVWYYNTSTNEIVKTDWEKCTFTLNGTKLTRESEDLGKAVYNKIDKLTTPVLSSVQKMNVNKNTNITQGIIKMGCCQK